MKKPTIIEIELNKFGDLNEAHSLMSELNDLGYDSHIDANKALLQIYAPFGVVMEMIALRKLGGDMKK